MTKDEFEAHVSHLTELQAGVVMEDGWVIPLGDRVNAALHAAIGALSYTYGATSQPRKHEHYFKDVRHLDVVDVYRVLLLFGVTDPALQHIAKKALCAGQRGAKDFEKDVREIADTANRRVEMIAEDHDASW